MNIDINQLARESERLVIDADALIDKASKLITPPLFDTGGHITGGAALALITNTSTFGDIDFFFEHEVNFNKAHNICASRSFTRRIHLCLVGHTPVFERFDLTANMCSISKEGVFIDRRCVNTIENGLCRVLHENVIKPSRTLKRIQKYRNRGYFIPEADALPLFSQITVEAEERGRWGHRSC